MENLQEQQDQQPSFAERAITTLFTVLLPMGKPYALQFLDKFYETNPTGYKVGLAAVYPVIDVYIEDLAQKTGTQIDDTAVSAIKSILEESAAKYGVQLSNLDQD